MVWGLSWVKENVRKIIAPLLALLAWGGFIQLLNANPLEPSKAVETLTLFTLPLVIGSLLPKHEKRAKRAANAMLLSSVLMIGGYLFVTFGKLGQVETAWLSHVTNIGGLIVVLGTFFFSWGIIEIMFYAIGNFIKDY